MTRLTPLRLQALTILSQGPAKPAALKPYIKSANNNGNGRLAFGTNAAAWRTMRWLEDEGLAYQAGDKFAISPVGETLLKSHKENTIFEA